MPTPTTQQVCVTVPTFEGLRQGAEVFHREIVVKHPFLLASGLVLLAYYPKSPFTTVYYVIYGVPKAIIMGVLHCLGFGNKGVRQGSYAAKYQSRVYGGYIPKDSTFSTYQSYGALDGGSESDGYEEEKGGFFWWAVGWGFMITAGIVLIENVGGK